MREKGGRGRKRFCVLQERVGYLSQICGSDRYFILIGVVFMFVVK